MMTIYEIWLKISRNESLSPLSKCQKFFSKCFLSFFTDNGIPDILQRVYMTVISNIDCSNKWSVVSGGINDGHICIGNDEDVAADKSACFVSTCN